MTQTPIGVQTSLAATSMSGVFTCSAYATPDAASVNIRSCQLRTSGGQVFDDTITIQQTGPAAVTGSAFAGIPIQSLRVCMQTEVIWLTGEKQLLPERCS